MKAGACHNQTKGMESLFKIAVIDDNRAIVEMIATTIKWDKLDCMICGTAFDGVRGQALIARENPDIIIADILMPGLDGLEMVKNLHMEKPSVKVIFISAYDDFSYAQKALFYHAYEYLLKPFESEKLISSVRRAIDEIRHAYCQSQEEISATASLVNSIIQYINEHHDHPTLKEVADRFGFSPSYISTLVKKETGENYIDLVVRSRINQAKRLLRDPSYRIEEVAQAVGYKNYISFYKLFTKVVGISPREHRNAGDKE